MFHPFCGTAQSRHAKQSQRRCFRFCRSRRRGTTPAPHAQAQVHTEANFENNHAANPQHTFKCRERPLSPYVSPWPPVNNPRPGARALGSSQGFFRREFKSERHEVREQNSPLEQTSTKVEAVQGGACHTERADVASPQAHLETHPDRAREKPRRASYVAGPRIHGE